MKRRGNRACLPPARWVIPCTEAASARHSDWAAAVVILVFSLSYPFCSPPLQPSSPPLASLPNAPQLLAGRNPAHDSCAKAPS